MLAGDIYAPRKIRLVDVPEPTLDKAQADDEFGELIFQPELACLCGSDLPYFDRDYPEFMPQVGQSLHEMIGTVVDSNGSRFQVGDRVLCVPVDHFGLYQRYRVSARRCIPLDPRPPEDQALLAQPLGTVICALKKLRHVIDQNVVVMGQGPMGQLFNVVLRNLGARQIIAVDVLASRLHVSPHMGATTTIDASQQNPVEIVRDLTEGKMADLVVEAVGHREQVLNVCSDLCRQEGKILFFGVPEEMLNDIQWKKLFWKNLSIQTSVGPDFTCDFPLAMRWIAEQRLNVAPIITHRFPLSQIQEAFDLFRDRRDGALKVFVDFRDDV